MDKAIFLTIWVVVVMLGCNSNLRQQEEALSRIQDFHKEFKDFNFEQFKCMNILQWNQNRINRYEEYHIEFYPDYHSGNSKPLRGKLRFKNGAALFESEEIKNEMLPQDVFENFHRLNVSNLSYQNKLILTIYPNIRIIHSCNREEEYVAIDSCWHYKINNAKQ
jgi:hypothetical protein